MAYKKKSNRDLQECKEIATGYNHWLKRKRLEKGTINTLTNRKEKQAKVQPIEEQDFIDREDWL